MTYRELLAILLNMQDIKHTAIDSAVVGLVNDEYYSLDLVESLNNGEVKFIPAAVMEITDAD